VYKKDMNPQQVPLSERDKYDVGNSTIDLDEPENLVCGVCLANGNVTILYGTAGEGACPIHGAIEREQRFPRIKLDDEGFQEELLVYLEELSARKRGLTMEDMVTRQYSLAKIDQQEVASMTKQIMYSLVGIKATYGPQADAAAHALALVSVTYQLDPMMDEIQLLPTKWTYVNDKPIAVDWTLFVGYRGWEKAAKRAAAKENTRYVFGESRRMSPQEIEERGGHICSKCNGTGTTKKGKADAPCKKCNGKCKFDPSEVVGIVSSMYVVQDKEACDTMGIKYFPTIGIGIWQPGDSIPDTKDAAWMGEKRARVDALRRRWPMPFIFAENQQDAQAIISSPGFEIEKPPHVEFVEAAEIAAITVEMEHPDAYLWADRLVKKYNLADVTSVIDLLTENKMRVISKDTLKKLDGILTKEKEPDAIDGELVDTANQPLGAEKGAAQKFIAEHGYSIGKPQNNLIAALYGKDATWANITNAQMLNMEAYVKIVHGSVETGEFSDGTTKFGNLNDLKVALKQMMAELSERNEVFGPKRDS